MILLLFHSGIPICCCIFLGYTFRRSTHYWPYASLEAPEPASTTIKEPTTSPPSKVKGRVEKQVLTEYQERRIEKRGGVPQQARDTYSALVIKQIT